MSHFFLNILNNLWRGYYKKNDASTLIQRKKSNMHEVQNKDARFEAKYNTLYEHSGYVLIEFAKTGFCLENRLYWSKVCSAKQRTTTSQ